MRLIGKRGQEEAPVELLIGVVVLTFVLLIGYMIYMNLCVTQYEARATAALSKFARELEVVYQGAPGTTKYVELDFRPPDECNIKIESIRIARGLPSTCQRRIGRADCVSMFAVVYEEGQGYSHLAQEVLNIPSIVQIVNLQAQNPLCNNGVLSGLLPDSWSDADLRDCGWLPRFYSLKVTKTAPDRLEIGSFA